MLRATCYPTDRQPESNPEQSLAARSWQASVRFPSLRKGPARNPPTLRRASELAAWRRGAQPSAPVLSRPGRAFDRAHRPTAPEYEVGSQAYPQLWRRRHPSVRPRAQSPFPTPRHPRRHSEEMRRRLRARAHPRATLSRPGSALRSGFLRALRETRTTRSCPHPHCARRQLVGLPLLLSHFFFTLSLNNSIPPQLQFSVLHRGLDDGGGAAALLAQSAFEAARRGVRAQAERSQVRGLLIQVGRARNAEPEALRGL
jgi:hypothetical protein